MITNSNELALEIIVADKNQSGFLDGAFGGEYSDVGLVEISTRMVIQNDFFQK